MRRIALMARQDFLKYVTRRGFLISVMLFPLWISIVAILPQMLDRATPSRVFTVVDRAGGYQPVLADAVTQTERHATLNALAAYAGRHADLDRLRRSDPAIAAMLDNPDDQRESDAFAAMGGWKAVTARLKPALLSGAPNFVAPLPRFRLVPAPKALTDASPSSFADAASSYLNGERTIDGAQLFAIVVIPKDFGAAHHAVAQYWGTNLTDGELKSFVQQALKEELRNRALGPEAHDTARETRDVSANLQSFNPIHGDHEVSYGEVVASYVPMFVSFLLFLVVFMNASVLLQGVIEEKSSRMIEVLLSCATPHEIMIGKLFGVIGVSLATILLWGLGLFGMMALFSPDTIGFALGGLKAIATVQLLPLLLLYFVCGLLIYSSIFLGIGSMTASMADAQALLGPVTLIIFLPNLMVTALMRDPNGTVATVISWIPIYTPFFMIFRLPSHPPPLEIAGTALLAVATATFLMFQMGRVFARHVLTTERPPSFAKLVTLPIAWLTGKRG